MKISSVAPFGQSSSRRPVCEKGKLLGTWNEERGTWNVPLNVGIYCPRISEAGRPSEREKRRGLSPRSGMKTRTIFQRDPKREREKKKATYRGMWIRDRGEKSKKILRRTENFLARVEQVVRETYFRSKIFVGNWKYMAEKTGR